MTWDPRAVGAVTAVVEAVIPGVLGVCRRSRVGADTPKLGAGPWLLLVSSAELVRLIRRVCGFRGGGPERQRRVAATVETIESTLASSPRTTVAGFTVPDRNPDRGCGCVAAQRPAGWWR